MIAGAAGCSPGSRAAARRRSQILSAAAQWCAAAGLAQAPACAAASAVIQRQQKPHAQNAGACSSALTWCDKPPAKGLNPLQGVTDTRYHEHQHFFTEMTTFDVLHLVNAAGYQLHPATLDAVLQAAQLVSTTALPDDFSVQHAVPLRQQLISLRSFVPAAGSSTGAGGRLSPAPSCIGVDAATASLQTAADSSSIAQLRGFAFAESGQLGGAPDAAAAQQEAAAVTDFTYQTMWSVDCPEAATVSSSQVPNAAARHHRISLAGPAAGRRSVRLRAQQPPVVAATAMLAALQQSASSRDQQVPHECMPHCS